MLCTNPFVRDKSGKVFHKAMVQGDIESMLDGIPFPCGQCLACRINKRRVWTHRLILEALDHEVSSFITLTYSDESLVYSADAPVPVVCKRDVQLFLKRLRKLVGPFRYYLCGEYGGLTHRPHYHAILFGIPPNAGDYILKAWSIDGVPIGHIQIGECTPESIQYVAGYVTKKFTKKGDGLQKEFAIMSRKPGIGANCIEKLVELFTNEETGKWFDVQSNLPTSLMHGHRSLPLGRYLTNKLRDVLGIDNDIKPFLLQMFYKHLEAKQSGKYFGNYLESILIDESKQRNLQLAAIHKIYRQRTQI